MTSSTPETTLSPRERLLETARALFYSRGVNNVGIDLILAESGVAKATLYKYFRTKDDLIVEYMRRGDLRWCDWLRAGVERRSSSPENQLMMVWDALEEWFALPLFRGCLLSNVVLDLAPLPEHPARAVLLEHKERVRAYFEELAHAAGVADPRAVSETWMLLMEGATVVAARERSTAPAGQARAMAQALLGEATSSARAPSEEPSDVEDHHAMLEHLDLEL